ncbi:ATP-binding protein [Lyngbya aestuarii]|uniref:ATP-binding protein n=1 Tax=Lyngbya aestuarii TaxID=118322 RepID=UPI00403DC108
MDLKYHQFISFFEAEQAEQLCQIAITENFPNQKILFEEGEKPDFLYLILVGKVVFKKHIAHNQYQTLAQALPNAYFGELGILDGQPRSAQAIVCEGSTLAKLERQSLMEILLNAKGSTVLKVFGYTTQRLRDSTDQYVKQLIYKEKMVLVGEMLNTVIHDFKSPLSGINLSSSMVKELHPDLETVEWCELIQAQAQRMSAMAEELLEFSRGNTVLRKKPVNLAKVLERFEKLNHIYLQEAQVELVIKAVDVVVNADENKLLRVVQNLVSNAVEAFNHPGGRVEITVGANGRWGRIKITDNGPGIPEEIQEQFFEPFVTHGKRGGTGLGTAIAKSIIDAHGGDISFESSCQKGTVFCIILPLVSS